MKLVLLLLIILVFFNIGSNFGVLISVFLVCIK